MEERQSSDRNERIRTEGTLTDVYHTIFAKKGIMVYHYGIVREASLRNVQREWTALSQQKCDGRKTGFGSKRTDPDRGHADRRGPYYIRQKRNVSKSTEGRRSHTFNLDHETQWKSYGLDKDRIQKFRILPPKIKNFYLR